MSTNTLNRRDFLKAKAAAMGAAAGGMALPPLPPTW